jgi:REP element-mobilizing transposase RayT
MNQDSFALLVTWTCYGTWLPGDERGHASNVLLPGGGFVSRQNAPGTPYAASDAHTHARARAAQKGETVWLTKSQAQIAATGLVKAAAERGWRILRAALMRNHAHVLICNCPDDGPTVRRILKGVSQAALNDVEGIRRWWTAGGSDRYKHGDEAIESAYAYVANQEGKLVEIIDMQIRVIP